MVDARKWAGRFRSALHRRDRVEMGALAVVADRASAEAWAAGNRNGSRAWNKRWSKAWQAADEMLNEQARTSKAIAESISNEIKLEG